MICALGSVSVTIHVFGKKKLTLSPGGLRREGPREVDIPTKLSFAHFFFLPGYFTTQSTSTESVHCGALPMKIEEIEIKQGIWVAQHKHIGTVFVFLFQWYVHMVICDLFISLHSFTRCLHSTQSFSFAPMVPPRVNLSQFSI